MAEKIFTLRSKTVQAIRSADGACVFIPEGELFTCCNDEAYRLLEAGLAIVEGRESPVHPNHIEPVKTKTLFSFNTH